MIETLLDTDDGLNNHAVEWIQETAVQKTQEHWNHKQQQLQQQRALAAANQSTTSSTQPRSPSLNDTWWFLCGTDHIEWHNREIFQLMEDEFALRGISSGVVGLRQKPLFCTSAGFTRVGIAAVPRAAAEASNPDARYSHVVFPKDGYSNHALTFYFPECTTPNGTSAFATNGNYSACWHREYPHDAFIIKSRTITSDSMDHLNVGKTKDYRDVAWLNATDYPLIINDTYWEVLQNDFHIQRRMVNRTSSYIYEHRRSIITQNKQSRCTPGFPCGKVARRNLVRMERYWAKQRKAAAAGKQKGGDQSNQKTAQDVLVQKEYERIFAGKAAAGLDAPKEAVFDVLRKSLGETSNGHQTVSSDTKKNTTKMAPDIHELIALRKQLRNATKNTNEREPAKADTKTSNANTKNATRRLRI
jgi:hypothetical protein